RECQRVKIHRRFVGANEDSAITLPERVGPSGPTIILHPLTTEEPGNPFWKWFFSKRLERDDIRIIKALFCQRGHDNILHLGEKMFFMLANLGFGGASERGIKLECQVNVLEVPCPWTEEGIALIHIVTEVRRRI